ncbi:hypothetical protein [Sinorhizobium mexicanum]|uniref:Uncharacterized protein n=1 Tax=Sinorhizobium mexicanum TaxID=375549 RepID=A0A859QF74_9HYPH|nr:hypothetical protein [Sinorhizobium mexicanum]MBP1884128.1 hypothetical protein [Sinorhizobium mexicanum]QLL64843.1 hypothetical protein FKV68_25965 [Sinorhizobium mexicanum]
MPTERDKAPQQPIDEDAPGTIVGGPEAHAREKKGKDPVNKKEPTGTMTPPSRGPSKSDRDGRA